MNGTKIPKVIAHRGDSANYPENTYLALHEALKAGAAGVEFDVHLSQDHVPIVIHDRKLLRTTGKNGSVFDLIAKDIIQYNAGYPERFGEQYADEKIPSLKKIVELLLQWPSRLPFVELKRGSLSHYGLDIVLENVLPVLTPLQDRYVLISYNQEALAAARERGIKRIGWVFDDPNDQNYKIAHELKPEFLISDAEAIPDDLSPLWPGDWKWMLFEINDPQRAIEFAARGAASIETNSVQTFTQDERFAKDHGY